MSFYKKRWSLCRLEELKIAVIYVRTWGGLDCQNLHASNPCLQHSRGTWLKAWSAVLFVWVCRPFWKGCLPMLSCAYSLINSQCLCRASESVSHSRPVQRPDLNVSKMNSVFRTEFTKGSLRFFQMVVVFQEHLLLLWVYLAEYYLVRASWLLRFRQL